MDCRQRVALGVSEAAGFGLLTARIIVLYSAGGELQEAGFGLLTESFVL